MFMLFVINIYIYRSITLSSKYFNNETKIPVEYTVLRRADHSYIINGDNIISDSGIYNAAGAAFDYRRIDDAIETSDESNEGVTEWITATGPVREEIHLMVTIFISFFFI